MFDEILYHHNLAVHLSYIKIVSPVLGVVDIVVVDYNIDSIDNTDYTDNR